MLFCESGCKKLAIGAHVEVLSFVFIKKSLISLFTRQHIYIVQLLIFMRSFR